LCTIASRPIKTKHFAEAGSLSVINPGEIHTGEREHGSELCYAALYLPGSAVKEMSLGRVSAIRQPVIDDLEVWQNLSQAHRLSMTGCDDTEAAEALVCGIALLFQRYGVSRPILQDADCPKAVARAVDYMQSFAGEAIGLEDVSKSAGIGPFHLIRLFKKHMGTTPHAYLTQIRIDKSRQLLLHSASISQVALDVGFADQAHFTKRFKQLTGTTPAYYARSIQ
jgi:AraC-like DNA-binding protein